MKGSRKKIVAFVFVVAIAFGVGLSELHAWPVTKGTFKMPFDADMGMKTVSTGDYSFYVNKVAADGMISIYQGTKGVVMLRAESFSPYEDKSEKPVLIFVRHDGIATLRALKLPEAGTFYFTLPKQLKNLVAQQPQMIETVSVQVSGD